MSYHQRGRNPYRQNSPSPPHPPSQPPPNQVPPQRSPSFIHGDDAFFGVNPTPFGLGENSLGSDRSPERVRMALGRQDEELFMEVSRRGNSKRGTEPDWTHEKARPERRSQYRSTQSDYPEYNPQLFPRPSQHHTAQMSRPPDRASYHSAHQPYIPAAYADLDIRQQGLPGNAYSSPMSPSTGSPFSHHSTPSAQYRPSLADQAQQSPTRRYLDRSGTARTYDHMPPATPPRQQSIPNLQFNPLPTSPGTLLYNAQIPDLPHRSPQRHDAASAMYNRLSHSINAGHSDSPSQYYRYPYFTHGVTGGVDYDASLEQDEELEGTLMPTQGPPPPPHMSPRSSVGNRHPQARPLPGIPQAELEPDEDYFVLSNGRDHVTTETLEPSQQELYDELEDEWLAAGNHAGGRLQLSGYDLSAESDNDAYDNTWASTSHTPVHNGSTPNHRGSGSPLRYDVSPNSEGYDDSSDVEALGGLAAMQIEEERDKADEFRRISSGSTFFAGHGSQRESQRHQSPPATMAVQDGDIDVLLQDMGTLSGGYAARLSYGGDPDSLALPVIDHGSSFRARSTSTSAFGPAREPTHYRYKSTPGSYNYEMDPFAPSLSYVDGARVDAYGTGGFAEPTAAAQARRLSFNSDDERAYLDDQMPESEPPELFYHPGLSNRPLPLPPNEGQLAPATDVVYALTRFRSEPDALNLASVSNSQTILVPRSASLLSHSSTPQVIQPARAKTDAEERKLRAQNLRFNALAPDLFESPAPSGTTPVALDLPTLPKGKRFYPAKLQPNDFKKCAEPWALSSTASWLQLMTEGESDLRQHSLAEALVALFTFKVPTMHIIEAEALADRVIQEMFTAGVLRQVEEWVRFTEEGTLSGVLYQLTGSGCYAPRLHNSGISGRCYSHHCQRTIKKIAPSSYAQRASEDWQAFYKLGPEQLKDVDKKEIERQMILHEVVQTEEGYMEQLNVLLVLYRDALRNTQPPVISPKRLNGFLDQVFANAEPVKRANEEHLLGQLKYRQKEQGPFIVGFSDIFREWIRKAKAAYIEYAGSHPRAVHLLRQESDKNMLFRTFLDKARQDPRSNRLDWNTYLKAPITRLQRYSLLLATAHKNMQQDSEEKTNLQIAIDEIRAVTKECDAKVAESMAKLNLSNLNNKLQLRDSMRGINLNLDHLGRELIYQGDLQRTGSNRFTWLDITALLFDHYLVLAKTTVHSSDQGKAKFDRLDVSKAPIPMDLLVLVSTNDDPVVKSSVKGLATVSTVATKTSVPLSRISSNANAVPGRLEHTNSSSSQISGLSTKTSTITSLDSGGKDEKVLWPFRVNHLGRELYTLYAPTQANRQEWCEKIFEAKTKHAASLFAQNAEPFRLRVIADSAFAYDSGYGLQKPNPIIKGTPLDRAIEDVEQRYADQGRPPPVCRAKVNCATTYDASNGKQMCAVGTDNAVYVSEVDNPRGWTRAVAAPRVTQIAVLEEFNLMLLIQDKSLLAFHLDTVSPSSHANNSSTSSSSGSHSARKAPQKLSGSRDVGFFATGRVKNRMLVFYKKREGLSSTFKVLEPVYHKSNERLLRVRRFGDTEFFREFDSFYIPTECTSINVFHSTLAVSTSKGFEVLTLDKKVPFSVPDLRGKAVASIGARINGLEPLGMFKLNSTTGEGTATHDSTMMSSNSNNEFLLVYTDCAIYMDKHGEISRSVVMEFVGKACGAALYGPYILLFDNDFVEVRNAQNGRLRQVIAGRDVKLLDDGLNGGLAGRTVKFCMQHPAEPRNQVVLELLLNEGLKE